MGAIFLRQVKLIQFTILFCTTISWTQININGSVEAFNSSCSVHNNVNCNDWDDFNTLKKSVFKIYIPDEGSCTATLLNTNDSEANMRRSPVFITSRHCIHSGDDGGGALLDISTMRFYFNYQNPTCDLVLQNTTFSGIYPYFTNQRINRLYTRAGERYELRGGATLIDEAAFGVGTDIALLKMNVEIPPHFNVAFAGWDAGGILADIIGSQNRKNIIHHPSGDVKKISESYYPILISPAATGCKVITRVVNRVLSFFGFGRDVNVTSVCVPVDPSPFYILPAWSDGTVEGGSSGSSFLSNEKLVMGALSGNAYDCKTIELTSIGRLDKFYGASKNARYALDPKKQLWGDLAVPTLSYNCYSGSPLVLNGNYFPARDYQPDNRIDVKSTGEIRFASGVNTDHNNGNFRLFDGSDFNFECTAWETGNGVFEVNGVFDPQLGKTCSPSNPANARMSEATGAFENTNFDPEFVKETDATTEEIIGFSCSPNPISNKAKLNFYLPYELYTSINIYDALGKHVKTVFDNSLHKEGEHEIALSVSDIPNGIYVCRLVAGEYSQSIKLTVTK
jgi:hypothetical protein